MSMARNHVIFSLKNMLEFTLYIKYNLKIIDTLTPNRKAKGWNIASL